MVRLIDAMKTVTNMSGRITPLIKMGENPMRVYQEVLQVIAEAPTVDSVAVVRCRDCKHRGTDYCIFHIKGEPADEELLRKLDNDFCSYGERKDGDKDYGKAD